MVAEYTEVEGVVKGQNGFMIEIENLRKKSQRATPKLLSEIPQANINTEIIKKAKIRCWKMKKEITD